MGPFHVGTPFVYRLEMVSVRGSHRMGYDWMGCRNGVRTHVAQRSLFETQSSLFKIEAAPEMILIQIGGSNGKLLMRTQMF